MPLKNLTAFFSAMYVANEDSGQHKIKTFSAQRDKNSRLPSCSQLFQEENTAGTQTQVFLSGVD